MDFKAVISNSGDEKLYKPLSQEVERRLPNADVEWKRSYGRSCKNVVLQANFLKLDSIELKKSINSAASLATRPMLHLFWTACADNDQYKSKVKASISQWLKKLKENDIADWLIIYVVNQDSSKSSKPKIQLPRSSVYDKIKSDFTQKKQDKCVQLWEPDKETLFTKSGESWQILLTSLRNLLLESFGRHLDTFEDQIRVLREKYADPDWPFVDYFLVHEELALIYQSVTLKEDALIQYDEVDALLSQFIINTSTQSAPTWLINLQSPPNCWDGVSLATPTADRLKLLIKNKKTNLLEVRNYLFSRQVKLLIKLKKKWEIPSRLLDFLFATSQELELLKIHLKDGVIALWMILTCMQLFQHLESFESNDLAYHAIKTQLHDLMRIKCFQIGTLTGLYYNRSQTESERNKTKELLSGIGIDDNSNENSQNSSVRVIKNAFNSALDYQKFYLDLSIKCMELYFNIKRQHFGLVVGIDIAKFYLEHSNYLEAEPLLEKAWTVYKQQKWETLYIDVLIPLANCQYKHFLYDRYLNSVVSLACAYCLPLNVRQEYANEIIKLSKENNITLPSIEMEPVFQLSNIKMNLIKNKGHVGDCVKISLSINNRLTDTLYCQLAQIKLKHFELTDPESFDDAANQRSLFNPKDYGMNVSIHSNEATIDSTKDESSLKENLTPSNILKRLKSHRRTWSRNKNVIDTSKLNESNNSAPPTPAKEPLHKSYSAEDILQNKQKDVKKTLFSPDTDSDSMLPNGDTTKSSTSLLEISRSKSLLERSSTESNSNEKVFIPIATSSVSENAIDQISNIDEGIVEPSISSDTSISNDAAFETAKVDSPGIMLEILEPLALQSGITEIEFVKEISTEGRYALESIHVNIGQLKFESIFNLPKNLQSFFIVADPPKITWTTKYMSEYLLSCSKQRLHITLLNGPGLIKNGSLLRLFSKSGLQFFDLEDSSIEVFPLERDGSPREAVVSISKGDSLNEALVKLPECRPYERVNLYFDAMSLIENHKESVLQHEIEFSNDWLKDYVEEESIKLECIFYSPFNINKQTYTHGEWCFVHVTVYATNPVPLLLTSAQLIDMYNNDLSDLQLMSHPDEVCLFGNENYHFVWRAILSNMSDYCQNCKFQLKFQSKNSDVEHSGLLEEKIQITFSQKKYSFHVLCDSKPCKSQLTKFQVKIKRLVEIDVNHKFYIFLDSEEINWVHQTSSSLSCQQIIFNDNDTETVITFELLTECCGNIPLPLFQLGKVNTLDDNIEDGMHVMHSYEVDNLSLGKSISVGDKVTEV